MNGRLFYLGGTLGGFMAYIHRIVIYLLFIAPSLLSNTVLAAAPVIQWYQPYATTVYHSTPEAACDAFIVSRNAIYNRGAYKTSLVSAGSDNYTCNYFEPGQGNFSVNISPRYYCYGSPQTSVGSGFNCPTAPPPPCTAGELVSEGIYDNGLNPNATFPYDVCVNQCQALFEGTWPSKQSLLADGMHYYGEGEYRKNGATCSGGASPPPALDGVPPSLEEQEAAAQKAAEEQVAAALKAQKEAEAAAKSAADKLAAQEAAAQAAADKLAAEAAAQKAADEAKKAEEVNNDPNSSQAEKDAANAESAAADAAAESAAQQAAQSAGQAAAAMKDDAQEEQPDFCELHPSSIICKESKINAGFCIQGESRGFTCDGDKIQCAMAKEQQRRNCEIFEKDDEMNSKFEEMKQPLATNPASDDNREVVNIQSTLDASSNIAATCPIDKTFIFQGQTITLPLSDFCNVLEAIGYLFLGISYIAAARIIGGSV